METLLHVFLDVKNAEGVRRSRQNVSQRLFNPFLAVGKENKTFAVILNVEGRLHKSDEPRPRRRVFTLGYTESDGEDLAIPVQRGHDEQRPSVARLNMTGVEAADFRGVQKCVPTDSGTDEGPEKDAVLRHHTGRRPFIPFSK